MPCNPDQFSANPPVIPGIPIDGVLPFAPVQLPFPDVSLPTGIIQKIQELVDKLGLQFPSGTFKPTVDNYTKVIFDLIASLLTQVAPFLSIYNFFMSLLNIINCIIEVLCAIPNPFKLANAMVKLFTQCLPPFLNLFPWAALIAMIIALLLLILALIEYLIATIIGIIKEIIRNLEILGKGVTFQDAESTLQATAKLAELLCLIENIMAILVALSAIMAIIKALASFAGTEVCSGSDPNGCCSPDICPPFIKESPLTGHGQLRYSSGIGVDAATMFGISAGAASILNLPPVRTERWQFINTDAEQAHQFAEIITPVIDTTQFPPVFNTFWPEGVTFDDSTPSAKLPYRVDLRIKLDPKQFKPSDTGGERYLRVLGAGTIRKPYLGIYNYKETLISGDTTGTLNLEGGLVYEDDGTTPFLIAGEQATLNNFIHLDDTVSIALPVVDDQIIFNDVEFTFTPNFAVLMGYNLITLGCMPGVRLEKDLLNSILIAEDIRAVIQKLPFVNANGVLPDIDAAQQCIIGAMTEFRKSVSIASAAQFQANVELCLGDLKNQTISTICGAILVGVSQFKSEIEIDTDVQFTSRPIDISITLRDPSGINIAANLPPESVSCVTDKLVVTSTLGEVSKPQYDGSSKFVAKLTSKVAGSGVISANFDGKVFNKVIGPIAATLDTAGSNSKIEENIIDFTFIDAVATPAVRRGPEDVSGNEE